MLRFTGASTLDYPALAACGTIGDCVVDSPTRSGFCQDVLYPSVASPPSCPALSNPLVKKLEPFVRLDSADLQAVDSLLAFPKVMRTGQILIHEGIVIDHVYLIVRGMACRYKFLPGGERQILGYLIPGDLCDIHFIAVNKPDHSVALLSDAEVIKIPTQKISALLASHPRIERALSHAALLDMAILREWLLNVGQRNAMQKLSHFFCEMKLRLSRIGLVAEDGSFELPINQMALADTTGLTPVHINRTLQRLRNEALIRLCHRRLSIVDPERLAAIAAFDDNYLQVKQCTR